MEPSKAIPALTPEGASARSGSPSAVMHSATWFTSWRNHAIPGLPRGLQGVRLGGTTAHHLQSEAANSGPWRRAMLAVSPRCAVVRAPTCTSSWTRRRRLL